MQFDLTPAEFAAAVCIVEAWKRTHVPGSLAVSLGDVQTIGGAPVSADTLHALHRAKVITFMPDQEPDYVMLNRAFIESV
jgi:hypothetical protein